MSEAAQVPAGRGTWTDAAPPAGLVGYLVRSFDPCVEETP
jgi:hypothetical protein